MGTKATPLIYPNQRDCVPVFLRLPKLSDMDRHKCQTCMLDNNPYNYKLVIGKRHHFSHGGGIWCGGCKKLLVEFQYEHSGHCSMITRLNGRQWGDQNPYKTTIDKQKDFVDKPKDIVIDI
jgi:hypothetical protein